jgi:polyphosphate kinase
MNLEDEFIGDISEKIEKQLEKREAGNATRLLYDKTMPADVKDFIQKYLQLKQEEMIEGGRYHNMKDLGSLPNPSKKNWLIHPGRRWLMLALVIINLFLNVLKPVISCCTCLITLTIISFGFLMKQPLTLK